MKLLKTLSLVAATGAIFLATSSNAAQKSNRTYVTECEYMPAGVFTIPVVDTYRSHTGYKTCPTTKIVNNSTYNLFYVNRYIEN